MFNWLKKILADMKVGVESDVAAIKDNDSITQLAMSESETFKNQGNAHLNNGQLEAAAECFRQAIALNPLYAEAYTNLGTVFQMQGNPGEAIALYRKAVVFKPNLLPTHLNLGICLMNLGQSDAAEESLRRVIALAPEHATASQHSAALQSLGVIVAQRGDFFHAEPLLRRALELQSDDVDSLNNLGNLLLQTKRLPEAEASYRRALELQPDSASVHYNLGNLFVEARRLPEAETFYRRALTLKPDYAEAHNNLGGGLRDLGKNDEAVASFRRAIEIKPDYADAHCNLIFALDLAGNVDMSELHGTRKKWDEACAAHLWQRPFHTNVPTPSRRLRVGYVSADFREHSAARAFGGMLTKYDQSQYGVFAYSNYKGKDDSFTELFRQNVTTWRNIADLSDESVAEMIRGDRIDILVDLSGFSAGNRLLVFARKPAPIQITAWGYATGTGMRAMDVFFADPVMVPPQEKQYFTEEVRYLPSFLGAFFTDPFPEVNELPALSDGFVTFGSLNRLAKVSAEVYRVWAEILLAVPRSRLVLKAPELTEAAVRKSVIGHFLKAGVAEDRILMLGRTSGYEHIKAYNQVDIALDPFPQGGGITALEGLMMGVPVVTLRWPTMSGRASASFMTTLGLTDWITKTRKEYVERAIQKANDLQSLAELRQRLRGMFASSVLGDQAAYARAVEREYRQLWQEWCARCLSKGRAK